MNREQLAALIKSKKSLLCVGLDSDIEKIPAHLKKNSDPIFEFNKAIIDATHEYSIAYKPNLAFYEQLGSTGWVSLERTIDYLKSVGDVFTIADAKRGDIGNSAAYYAKTFFERLDFDAVTVNPYMGYDTLAPFLDYKNKFTIILALTSNEGSTDLQLKCIGEQYLYEEVIEKTSRLGTPDQIMYVLGATKPEIIAEARKIIPDNFFLVPGVGAQGGDLKSVCKSGLNNMGGLIINSSRNIIYASQDIDFAEKARNSAFKLQQQMEYILKNDFFV